VVHLHGLAAALACTLAYWLADATILHRYIRLKYAEHRFINTFKATLIGLLYNCLTPFASGGQPMQVYHMTKNGVDAGDAASYVTAKSVVYQVCLTVYALAALFFTFNFFRERIPGFIFLLWIGVSVNALFITALLIMTVNRSVAEKLGKMLVSLLARLRLVKDREKTTASLIAQIALFNESCALIYKKKNELLISFAISLFQLGLYYSLTYLIYRGFGQTESQLYMIVSAQAILTLITAFVPVPGSSGAAEAGFYVFFEIFFPKNALVPSVFIWRALTYYACILAGGAAALWDMRGPRVGRDASGNS
jgi:uncharacterized protein (TIRG00374 family)